MRRLLNKEVDMFNLSLASRRLNQLTGRSKVNGVFTSLDKRWKLTDLGKLEDPSSDSLNTETNFKLPVETCKLESVLSTYGVLAKVADYWIGPSVTTYEISVPVGYKLEALMAVQNDIARDFGSTRIRIIQSVKRSSHIGIEIENPKRIPVNFKGLIKTLPSNLTLPLILGEDTYGNSVYADLVDMPHLLVAGTTGSGKSVLLNSIILTTLACKSPKDVRMILIDPKQVEFVDYENVPHLLEPIAYNVEEAVELLKKTVYLMEDRFTCLREVGAKKLSEYNEVTNEHLPYVLFVVDEYADLIMMGTSKERKEVERNMARIAQKARAVGIHMIAATQKPIREVVTPLLKANLPARIAFRVACGLDSRIILDSKGAETLTGKGDCLFKDPTAKTELESLKRIQAPYVSKMDTDVILKR
jgi:S-DNA-T family DNA segregation ATPase FtsK/SpoIIIE